MVLQYSTELPSLERDGYKAQFVDSGKELENESIEPDVIGSYVFIPKNLTFAKVISILSKAIKKRIVLKSWIMLYKILNIMMADLLH